MKKLPTVTVDCARWARGGKNGPAALKNTLGNMCCLGFATEQLTGRELKVPLDAHHQDAFKIPIEFSVWSGVPVPGLTGTPMERIRANRMADFNDAPDISDEERMRQLRPLAKQAGFRFRFINQDKL